MLGLRLITLRSLRRRPLRTLLSGFGIVLGVACLLAIRVTNQTALEALVSLFAGTAGQSDLVILQAEPSGDGLAPEALGRVAQTPGVQRAIPSLQVRSLLEGQDQDLELGMSFFGVDMGGLSLHGIDPSLDSLVRTYRLSAGEFLSGRLEARELVLVDTFAQDNDIEVGDRVGLLTPNGSQSLKVVGLMRREGPGMTNNGAFGVLPLATAQEFFDRPRQLDQIDVLADEMRSTRGELEKLKGELQVSLGPDYLVTYPASQGERVGQMLDGYQIGLNFLSGMALFVGAFLIYNAFSMTVVERTREFGFLRTLGMTRAQIARQVLVEASLLGLVGSALGVAGGVLLARGLVRAMELVFAQDLGPVGVSAPVALSSLLIGLVVTVFAAAVPAWQAGRVSPMEALRVRSQRREGWLLRRGWLPGLALLGGAAWLLILNPFPYDVQFRLGSATVFALFFGATLIIPGSVGIWELALRPLVRWLYGSSGRIGAGNLRRAKGRTTLTVAALMVGVSMILVTRGMTDSFRTDLESWLRAYMGGDLFVNSTLPMGGRVARHIEEVAGVQAVAPIRYFEVQWDRPGSGPEDLSFMAIDPAAHSRVTSFVFSDSRQDPQQALSQLAGGGAVFVSSVLSEKFGLSAGDSLRLRTRGGPQDFEVAAVVVDFFNQGQVIQGSWGDMRRFWRLNDANTYLVKVAPGFPVLGVRDQIERQYGARDHLTVESNLALIERALRLFRQSNSLFDVLALIAMLVAGLGVINTMTVNVLERTREIGMLRSIGMTRRQVLGMVLSEAGVMGLIGGGLGLLFGALLTRIFLWGMTAMAGYNLTLVLSWRAIGVGLLLALVVSQVAAILPARRAARLRILEAIQFE